MAYISQLLIALGLNQAGFKEGLDKANADARQFARNIKGNFADAGAGVQGLISQITGGLNPAIQTMGRVLSSSLAAVSASISNTKISMSAAAVGIGGGIAVAATAAAVGLEIIAKKGSNVVFEYQRMSEKTGIGIRDLQTLKAAGESVGVGFDVISLGFRKFSEVLADVGKGGSLGQSVLHALGVTAHEPMEALRQTAAGFQKMNDVTLEGAYAQILFGRAGLNYLPVLKQGPQVFDDYSKMVEKFGKVIGTDATKATDDYRKAMVELSVSWEGVKIASTPYIDALTTINSLMARFLQMRDTAEELGVHPIPMPSGVDMGAWKQVKSRDQQESDNKLEDNAQKDKQRSLDKDVYEQLHAHGTAAYALFKAQKEVQEAIVELDYVHAAQIEKTIPALQEAAKLEEQRRNALMNLPRTMTETMSGVSAERARAQAQAMHDATAEGVKWAALQDNFAIQGRLVDKATSENIAGTDNFKNALIAIIPQIQAETKFMEAYKFVLGSQGELTGFNKQTTEHLTALQGEASALTAVQMQQAKNTATLKPYQDRLEESKKVLSDIVSQYGVVDARTKDLVADVERLSNEYNAADKNVKAMNDLLPVVAYGKELRKITDQTSILRAENAALLGGDPFGKQRAELEKYIKEEGISVEDAKKLRASLEQQRPLQIQASATKAGAVSGFDPEAMTRMKKDIDYLNAGGWKELGMSAEQYSKTIASLTAQMDSLTVISGGMKSGMHAAFSQLIADTESMGKVTKDVLLKGINDLNDALANLVTGQKVKWDAFFHGIATSIAKSGLKNLEGGLAKSFHIGADKSDGSPEKAATSGFGSVLSKFFGGGGPARGAAGNPMHVFIDGGMGSAGGGGGLGMFGIGGGGGDAPTDFGYGLNAGTTFASGGDIFDPNSVNLIGERGPELFTPGTSGHVTSNSDLKKMFSGGGGATYYIDLSNTSDPTDNEMRMKQALAAVHTSAVRGGAYTAREMALRRPKGA